MKTLERHKLAVIIIIIIIIIIVTKNATHCNICDDMHHLSYILKISIFLVAYI